MEYKLMSSPFDSVSFEEMNKKQVVEYFKWFITEKENRITQLQEFINKTCGDDIKLDKTPQSLNQLWEWFEGVMEWDELSESDIKQRLEGRPVWTHEYILAERWDETKQTKAIAVDIATYFGETLIRNNPEISWDYRSKPIKLDGRNQPILVGFHKDITVNPRSIVRVLVSKSQKEKCPTRLSKAYNTWVGQII